MSFGRSTPDPRWRVDEPGRDKPRIPGSDRCRIYIPLALGALVLSDSLRREETQRWICHDALLRELGFQDDQRLRSLLDLLCPPSHLKLRQEPVVEVIMEIPPDALDAFRAAEAASDLPVRHQVIVDMIGRRLGLVPERSLEIARQAGPGLRRK